MTEAKKHNEIVGRARHTVSKAGNQYILVALNTGERYALLPRFGANQDFVIYKQ
jgi:hypothetical protein